jgi:hypothetical protein
MGGKPREAESSQLQGERLHTMVEIQCGGKQSERITPCKPEYHISDSPLESSMSIPLAFLIALPPTCRSEELLFGSRKDSPGVRSNTPGVEGGERVEGGRVFRREIPDGTLGEESREQDIQNSGR